MTDINLQVVLTTYIKVWHLATYEQIPNDIDYPIFSKLEDDITSDIIMLEKWKEIKSVFILSQGGIVTLFYII